MTSVMISLCFLLSFCALVVGDINKRSDDTSPLEVVVARLTSDLQTLEAKVTALTANLGDLNKQVGFTVTLKHDVSLPRGNMVKFDNVLFNNASSYAASSGFFVAPVSDMYYIFIKTETNGHGAGLEVFKEGAQVLHIYAKVHDAYQTPFDAVVTHLDRGQRVWVKTCCLDGLVVRTTTHFGGFLIHADVV